MEINTCDLHVKSVSFTATELVVVLADGRKISTPLDWYPRLKNASAAARQNYEIIPMGIHWPDLDEDLSVAGMLAGKRAVWSQVTLDCAGAGFSSLRKKHDNLPV